jgi:hypothetical protein
MQVGWYSEKQSELTGVNEYTTPDGRTVQVTEVISGETEVSHWSDARRVGQVVRWVRQISQPRNQTRQFNTYNPVFGDLDDFSQDKGIFHLYSPNDD